jgi:recombination protein RecR
MAADPLRRCVGQLSRLPGIGQRTATRLAYWLLNQPEDVASEIGSALVELHRTAVRCTTCHDIAAASPCARCSDPHRDPTVVCVVERPQDIGAIERTGSFQGHYHVLGGALAPLDGIGPDQLHVRSLLQRLAGNPIEEVLVATDPDVEGDATALYLARLVRPSGVKVTRLAHGVSVGTELEYADKSSVARALENRREI